MARILVVNNENAVIIEITQDPDDGSYAAQCGYCGPGINLVAGSHEQMALADTIEVASRHADHAHRSD